MFVVRSHERTPQEDNKNKGDPFSRRTSIPSNFGRPSVADERRLSAPSLSSKQLNNGALAPVFRQSPSASPRANNRAILGAPPPAYPPPPVNSPPKLVRQSSKDTMDRSSATRRSKSLGRRTSSKFTQDGRVSSPQRASSPTNTNDSSSSSVYARLLQQKSKGRRASAISNRQSSKRLTRQSSKDSMSLLNLPGQKGRGKSSAAASAREIKYVPNTNTKQIASARPSTNKKELAKKKSKSRLRRQQSKDTFSLSQKETKASKIVTSSTKGTYNPSQMSIYRNKKPSNTVSREASVIDNNNDDDVEPSVSAYSLSTSQKSRKKAKRSKSKKKITPQQTTAAPGPSRLTKQKSKIKRTNTSSKSNSKVDVVREKKLKEALEEKDAQLQNALAKLHQREVEQATRIAALEQMAQRLKEQKDLMDEQQAKQQQQQIKPQNRSRNTAKKQIDTDDDDDNDDGDSNDNDGMNRKKKISRTKSGRTRPVERAKSKRQSDQRKKKNLEDDGTISPRVRSRQKIREMRDERTSDSSSDIEPRRPPRSRKASKKKLSNLDNYDNNNDTEKNMNNDNDVENTTYNNRLKQFKSRKSKRERLRELAQADQKKKNISNEESPNRVTRKRANKSKQQLRVDSMSPPPPPPEEEEDNSSDDMMDEKHTDDIAHSEMFSPRWAKTNSKKSNVNNYDDDDDDDDDATEGKNYVTGGNTSESEDTSDLASQDGETLLQSVRHHLSQRSSKAPPKVEKPQKKASGFRLSDIQSAYDIMDEVEAVPDNITKKKQKENIVPTLKLPVEEKKTFLLFETKEEVDKFGETMMEENKSDKLWQHALKCIDDGYDTEAFWCFEVLAGYTGDADALFKLGEAYEKGVGTDVNIGRAVKNYLLASVQGHAESQYRVASCYYSGKDFVKDLYKAVFWYQKACANGHTEAKYMLAGCYARGEESLEQNWNKAVWWYTQAAKEKHVLALYELGDCATAGRLLNQQALVREAWSVLRTFVDNSHPELQVLRRERKISLLQNAKSHLRGSKTPRAPRSSINNNDDGIDAKLFRESRPLSARRLSNDLLDASPISPIHASDNEEENDPEAKYNSKMSRASDSFLINPDPSRRNMPPTVANANMSLAQTWQHVQDIGQYFSQMKPSEQGFLLYLACAENHNYPPAHVKVGNCYRKGEGVKRDAHEAAKHYFAAAKAKHPRGITMLGNCYWLGFGVAKNRDKAIKLFRLAANKDDEVAKRRLKQLKLS